MNEAIKDIIDGKKVISQLSKKKILSEIQELKKYVLSFITSDCKEENLKYLNLKLNDIKISIF